jgi:DUF4097 and DUF4098 domain-containing protein YvlB
MLGTILILLSLLPAAATDEWNKSFEVKATPELRILAGDGNIRVESWEKNSIETRVTTRGWKIGDDGISIYDSQSGDTVEIELRFPRRWFQVGFGDRRVDIDIKVPRNSKLNLRTGDGNINLREVSGPIVLHSGDGNLLVESVEGTLNATTGDGNIELRGIKGDVTAGSGDGRIDVQNVDGLLKINTGDGRVRAHGRFDLLDIKTGDGGVEAVAIQGSKLASDWRLKTGDGSLTLRVPSDIAADIDLETNDGHIDLELPVSIAGRAGTRTIKGQLNGGGRLLSLKTGDGSIRLEKL